jgi:hypothetical protein
MESQDNIRKRVCKACDRCRLKKSKVRETFPMFVALLTGNNSVTVLAHAVGVELTMLSVFLAKGKSRRIKCIQKGE